MLKKSLLLISTFVLCFSFAGTSAYAKDQLQTQDRLRTCDQFVDEDGDGICDNCDGVDCDGVGPPTQLANAAGTPREPATSGGTTPALASATTATACAKSASAEARSRQAVENGALRA